MIGLVISLAIEAVGLMIAVTIVMVRLFIRLGILIAAGVASLIACQRGPDTPAKRGRGL